MVLWFSNISDGFKLRKSHELFRKSKFNLLRKNSISG